MPKRILVCGADETLVETRRSILARSGYEVGTYTVLTAADRIPASPEVDLLVLCSSLSRDQQLTLLDQSHEERPGQKNLVVIAGKQDDRISSAEDIPFTALDGPAKFVKQVDSLLAS
jgi:DNA-binding NtrC family response regulator